MTVDDGGRPVPVKAGDKVFCNFVWLLSEYTLPKNMLIVQTEANRDAGIFPNPNEVDITRNLDTYIHYGFGPHACLGRDASRVALMAMLKVVGRLDNLRRAPGPQGQLKKVPREGGSYTYMRAEQASYFPFPTSKFHLLRMLRYVI